MSVGKKISIFLGIILLSVACYFCYDHYEYGAFKRAYEHGTVYEQLDVLMNSTRYVDAVRKAGYEIDDYNLMMTERIASLDTKNLSLHISSPSTYVTIRFRYTLKDQSLSVI